MNACILVVDDDPEIVGAIAITLEREGYRVLRAYDGMEALDLALDPAVRLILIDVMMPKLDGLSALLRIREKRNLPVIVLSAKSEDTDKILGLSMGADDYVTKPFNPQELAARVRSQLRRYTLLGGQAPEKPNVLTIGGICLDEAFGKQSIENLIKLNPDVIVVINRTDSPAQEKIDSLKANPSLASVPAVANDRFVSLDYVDFYGGNYETIDTIQHLAQGFYPDLFQ